MSDKKKRSKSTTKFLGMIENTLKKVERTNSREETRVEVEEEDEDSDNPVVLPILIRGSSTRRKKETEDISGSPKIISTEGMMKYEDMLTVLKCGSCSETSTPPLIQCRKGHIYCRNCKVENRMNQCTTCKQTFVDAPNLALDQLVRLIAIPCRYGCRGCGEFVFLDTRLRHETLCKFRPISCQFEKHGCTAVFSVKDMCWHHKMCAYANYPHPNVLPNMPTRKKGGAKPATGNGGTELVNGDVKANGEKVGKPVPAPTKEEVPAPTKEEGLDKNSIEVQTEIKLFPGVLSRK